MDLLSGSSGALLGPTDVSGLAPTAAQAVLARLRIPISRDKQLKIKDSRASRFQIQIPDSQNQQLGASKQRGGRLEACCPAVPSPPFVITLSLPLC